MFKKVPNYYVNCCSNRVTKENSVLNSKDTLKETLNKDIDVYKLSNLKLKSHIELVYFVKVGNINYLTPQKQIPINYLSHTKKSFDYIKNR